MRSCLEIYSKNERNDELKKNQFTTLNNTVYNEESPYVVSKLNGGVNDNIGKGVSINGISLYPGPNDFIPDETCTPYIYKESFLTNINYNAGNIIDNEKRKSLMNNCKYNPYNPYKPEESIYEGQFYV